MVSPMSWPFSSSGADDSAYPFSVGFRSATGGSRRRSRSASGYCWTPPGGWSCRARDDANVPIRPHGRLRADTNGVVQRSCVPCQSSAFLVPSLLLIDDTAAMRALVRAYLLDD